MRKYRILFLLWWLSPCFLQAQNNIPVGQWRMHLPYHQVSSMTFGKGLVFANGGGGLFSFDLDSKEIKVLSESLSDVGIVDLVYHEKLNLLIVLYENGNIDLLDKEGWINNRQIIDSDVSEIKMSSITIYKDVAYLNGSIGIVTLDLNTYRVVEVYSNIGKEGAAVPAFNATVLYGAEDSLFVAVGTEIRRASLREDVNLQDYQNWTSIGEVESGEIKEVSSRNSTILFGVNSVGLFEYKEGVVKEDLSFRNVQEFSSISNNGSDYFVLYDDKVLEGESVGGFSLLNISAKRPRCILKTDEVFVIGDQFYGVIQISEGEQQQYAPLGVLSNKVTNLHFSGKDLYAFYGGFSANSVKHPSMDSLGFSKFSNGFWVNYSNIDSKAQGVEIPPYKDIVDIRLISDNTYAISSLVDGVIYWQPTDNNFVEVKNQAFSSNGYLFSTSLFYDQFEGELLSARFDAPNAKPYVQAFDHNGNVVREFLTSQNAARFLKKIIRDNYQQTWGIVHENEGGGIWCFDLNGNKKIFKEGEGTGNLPSNEIFDFAFDGFGNIWVVGKNGVSVFYTYSDYLSSTNTDAIQPIFEGRPLLSGENVTSVVVDGANRKWFGTENGLWLFDESGSSALTYFTAANSGLISDKINSLAIDGYTGEVFIATDKGLCSFRSDATFATGSYSSVKVFPNPVRPNYDGFVTISELKIDSRVKIVSTGGSLVWEGKSNGGSISWNFTNSHVSTGIYFIYIVDSQGAESFAGSLAIVR